MISYSLRAFKIKNAENIGAQCRTDNEWYASRLLNISLSLPIMRDNIILYDRMTDDPHEAYGNNMYIDCKLI